MTRVYLPAQRGKQVLIFEHFEVEAQRRWDFRVVAAAPEPGVALERTGVGKLNAKDMQDCEAAAARLPLLKSMIGSLSLCGVDDMVSVLDAKPEMAVIEGSPLLTATVYAHFMRQILVYETSVRRYESREPAERADPGRSAALYNSMLRFFEIDRVEALVDADVNALSDGFSAPEADWRYFLGHCATVKQKQGKDAEAEVFLDRAAKKAPSDEIWRRLGNLRASRGAMGEAIFAFLEANRLHPLGSGPALRLARWLKDAGRNDEALSWAKTAAARGANTARELIDQLEN